MVHQIGQFGQRTVVVLCVVFIVSLAVGIGVPVSAADIIISPNDPVKGSIQGAINNASSGDTIVLNPGIYYEHGIDIPKEITIKANIAAGGDQTNTIIDGLGGSYGIFRDFHYFGSNLSIDNMTLRNGDASAAADGGAIFTSGGTVTITSSTFSNCSATAYTGNGGAIYAKGRVIVTSSTFSNCSADAYGGAIIAGGTATVTDSTFSNCQAGLGGGAIYSSGNVLLIDSTFSNCSASQGMGGVVYSFGGTVTDSTFSNCSAVAGGAIFAKTGSIMVTSSTFSDCSTTGAAAHGGAILGNYITVISSTFTKCSALQGGAISGGDMTITSSTFSDCSATHTAGAISGTVITATNSSFTNCSATTQASAILASQGGIIRFCRLVDNTGPSVIETWYYTTDATDNWWGSNNDPSALVSSGVTYSPWLVLGATATPASITSADTSTVQANITYDSDGTYHDPALGHVPNAIPVTYTVSSGPGSVSPALTEIINGLSQTTFTPTTSGTATVNATVDGQTVSAIIVISGGAQPTVLPGLINPPTDPDGDGIYEDLNGNGRLDFADVVLYFNQMTWIGANEPVSAFDLNGNGRIDFADIVALFNEI